MKTDKEIKDKLKEIGKITLKDNILNSDRQYIGLLIKEIVEKALSKQKQDFIKDEIKFLKRIRAEYNKVFGGTDENCKIRGRLDNRIKELTKKLKEKQK